MTVTVKFKKLSPGGIVPTRAHATDAAFDLYTPGGFELSPGSVRKVGLRVASEIPGGWYAKITERSGLAARGVKVLGGVIDPGYRGEWVVVLELNPTADPVTFRSGDRVAQVLFHPVVEAVVVEAEGDLSPSDRGNGGFGSTGR